MFWKCEVESGKKEGSRFVIAVIVIVQFQGSVFLLLLL